MSGGSGSGRPRAYTVISDAVLPPGLLDAFEEYEAALIADDTGLLDDFFEPTEHVVRSDADGTLVGHAAISAFRAFRGGVRARTITTVRIQVLSPTVALLVSTSEPVAGGFGTQTQLWRIGGPEGMVGPDARWRIAAAHVTAPAPAIDTRVWRTVGTPLLAGSSDDEAGPAPLAGQTLAVKDLYAVAGHRIGAGNPAFLAEAAVQHEHAPAVQALLDAGADITGIARTDEFAYSIAGRNAHYGTPPNPAAPGRIPGGSSSGPASAVALGQVSIGLGSDTAGSVRIPASYQGLWGMRTTHGAVSLQGVHPLAPSFDTVGWLTRSGELLERVAAASLPGGRGRLGLDGAGFVTADAVTALADAPVASAVRNAVARLAAALGAVAGVDLGDPDAAYSLFRVIQPFEAWQSDGKWLRAHPEPAVLAPDVAERFRIAAQVTEAQVSAARLAAARLRGRFDEALAGRILIVPSAASVAPPVSADADELQRVRWASLQITSIAGIGGYPAVSVPALELDGLPVGLSLVGPRDSDLALVAAARALAEHLDLSEPRRPAPE